MSATILNPEAKPSIPSIKLMEFVINTTNNTVNGMPNQADNSFIPKMPYRSFTYKPDNGIMEAAIN